MSDIIGFGNSPGLEGNDDDDDMLGSFLSWDGDEEESGVEASVVAAMSALEERDTANSTPTSTAQCMLPTFMDPKDQAAFMQQLSNMGSGPGQGIGFPSPIFQAQQAQQQQRQQQQAQQVLQQQLQQQKQLQQAQQQAQQQMQQQQQQMQMQQQQQQQQQVQQQQAQQQQAQQQRQMSQNLSAMLPVAALSPASGAQTQILSGQQLSSAQTQSRQATAASMSSLLPGFNMYQPAMFSRPNEQPLSLQGMLPMAQRTQDQQAQQQQRQDPQAQFNSSQSSLIQQMQQVVSAQIQQLAAQQQRTAVPVITQSQQFPTTAATLASGSKRKASDSQSTASGRINNIVSCSDTDGETTGKAEQPKKKAAKKAPSSSSVLPDTSPVLSGMLGSEDMTEVTIGSKGKIKTSRDRDRNREHARNTRLRKKAYMEKLKTTVDELCRERDTLVSERAGAANLLVEMHNTRTEVLMSFFALRSTNEKRRELWASILDESCFSCIMPVTPYRSFPASEVQVSKCQRTILGIDGMMADTASLHVLLNSLIDRLRYPTAKIQFRYTLVTEDAVVAGNQMMARWVMKTTNAMQCGSRMEVAKQGMLCCKFNSAHKIVGLELMFDVMAFMLQLKQAAGTESFAVIPNTVQTCQRSFDMPMVMTLAERPYTIVQVNKLWEDMTGFNAEDVVGKASCRVLQGQETDNASVEELMLSVRFKRASSAMLVNYSRTGKRFRNYVNVYPLSTDSKITHYVALTSYVDMIDVPGEKAPIPARPRPVRPTDLLEQASEVAAAPPQKPQASTGMVNGAGSMPHPALAIYSPETMLSNSGVGVSAREMGQIIPPSSVTVAAAAAYVTAGSSLSSSNRSSEAQEDANPEGKGGAGNKTPSPSAAAGT